MPDQPTAIATLAHLRLFVLAAGESMPEKHWDSDGLSQTNQNDLLMVFPRTSLVAAATHAGKLAQAHHDERTRASGVYHLFRLPTELEAGIHQELLHNMPNDMDLETSLWSGLEHLPKQSAAAQEGPINLGELDLKKPKDIAKLAFTYKAAIDAGVSCIPYFTIS
jgi:hypothetical protein